VRVPRFVSTAAESEAVAPDGNVLLPATGVADAEARFNATALADLSPQGGVLLLGEPGMGKTEAATTLADRWSCAGAVRWDGRPIDLAVATDFAAFQALVAAEIREVLSTAPADSGGHNPPCLFVLDNVDRCGLAPATLVAALCKEIDRPETAEACLVLACRTTEWPAGAHVPLQKRLPGFTVRHLLALERQQTDALAAAAGADPAAFQAALDQAGATALAGNPLTTNLLIERFLASGAATADPTDLFLTALTCLAAEPDLAWARQRRNRGIAVPPPQHRLAVAARIAAMLTLCGRTHVSEASVHHGQSALDVADVAGGEEPLPAGSVPVGMNEVDDALSCALFEPAGQGGRAPYHPSISACLTAKYLSERRLSDRQLRSVLLMSDDLGGWVHPPLREVAAWLVALDVRRFAWIVEADAETVAAYPYARAKEQVRAPLVDRLLELAGRESLRNPALAGFALDELSHPALEAQLAAALETGPAGKLRAAIAIAQATQSRGLSALLSQLAVDSSQDTAVRVRAVRALAVLHPATASKALRPVLLEPSEPLADELRGALLDVLWPDAISPEELVSALTRELSPLVFGLYSLFLNRLPDLLPDRALPAVLHWAAGEYPRGDRIQTMLSRRPSGDIAARLITRAWQAQDRTTILPALALLIRTRLFSDVGFDMPAPLGLGPGDSQDRRTLIALLVEDAGEHDAVRLAYSPVSRSLALLRPDDLSWLLDKECTASDSAARKWRQLMHVVFNPTIQEHRHLARAHLASTAWTEVFEPALAAPEPSSRTNARPPTPAPVAEDGADQQPDQPREALLNELVSLLNRAEAGDSDSFWQLCLRMRVDPETLTASQLQPAEMASLPGYSLLTQLDPMARKRLEHAALIFLDTAHPHTDEWIDTPGHGNWAAEAGYLAFTLLAKNRPSLLTKLHARTWTTWASALVARSGPGADENDAIQSKLLRKLARTAPGAATEPAIRMIRTAAAAGGYAHEIRFAPLYWTDELAEALAGLLDNHIQNPRSGAYAIALTLLIRQRHVATRTALDMLISEVETEEAPSARSVTAAACMLRGDLHRCWPQILRAMAAAPAWGRALVAELAISSDDSVSVLSEMTEGQLGQLYRWCLDHVPPESDNWEGSEDPTARHHDVAFWRERVINTLIGRATLGAVRDLTALATEQPQRLWLNRTLNQAREQIIAGGVTYALSTAEFHEMLHEAGRRIVRDSADLFQLVLEELDELQIAMQGAPPQAVFLWNEIRVPKADSRWDPKNEPEISDYVAQHLRDHLRARGAFTDREVEVERTSRNGTGRRIDLLVQAKPALNAGTASREECRVVIEVKGPWNSDLDTGIEKQLAKYMRKVGTGYGIYLVSWYPQHQWSPSDYRSRKSRSRLTRQELTESLTRQAEQERRRAGTVVHSVVLSLERPSADDTGGTARRRSRPKAN
jgi:hypothetical protein